MVNNFNLALIQGKGFADLKSSLSYYEQKCLQAHKQQADCILLPELHGNLYFPQNEDPANFDLAEPLDGPSFKQYSKLAKQLKIVIVVSIFEKRAVGIYHNTALVIEKTGELAGIYRKMHIPDDPGFYEKFYFTPGDLGFTPINTSLGKLGILICWDQWFSEAARIMALKGAEILLYPTAIGYCPSEGSEEGKKQLDAWLAVQRGHAIGNHLPVAACNRVGSEQGPSTNSDDRIDFWGNSFVYDPQGVCLAQSGETEDLIVTNIDKSRTQQLRQIWPFFRDRRIDHYGDLLNYYADNTNITQG